ncbi:class I SAM-dependent methyltransferase [Candidatus Methylocalor cossyra]|uniref:S-adenosyl-L-methionine-dependent methyltransferase n=1 Tax=Candidatus Methylocalor cossyra TaxID=3108543 RepID=A0ABM9NHD0_9GAMM
MGTAQLASFSNLGSTAYKRHIQSLHEHGDRRNPDILAGAFLAAEEREACLRLDSESLAKMRQDPYYYYLVARTKFYDQLLLDALASGIRRVLIVGAGFDTRFYRYGGHLAAQGAELAECDQPEAIEVKRKRAAALPHADRVHYFAIDLNRPATWDELRHWLGGTSQPVLLLAEGVSPYIEHSAFEAFLAELAGRLPAASRLAYDFKRSGVADEFGKSSEVSTPFRLTLDEEAIAAFHQRLGFPGAAPITPLVLMRTQVPSWHAEVSPLFEQDALIQIAIV